MPRPVPAPASATRGSLTVALAKALVAYDELRLLGVVEKESAEVLTNHTQDHELDPGEEDDEDHDRWYSQRDLGVDVELVEDDAREKNEADQRHQKTARAAGAGNLSLMFAKILPNALGPAMASGTLLVAQAILIEAGLSYLGLGDPSRVSLGLMLQQAQPIMRSAWWATAFPGLAIFATAITINLIGEGLTERWQPHAR